MAANTKMDKKLLLSTEAKTEGTATKLNAITNNNYGQCLIKNNLGG